MPYMHVEPYANHPWWGFFGWFLPVLLILLLAGVAVWLVARVTKERPQVLSTAPPVVPTPTPPADPLEVVRLRYARGEVGREEYVQVTKDLGGNASEGSTDDA